MDSKNASWVCFRDKPSVLEGVSEPMDENGPMEELREKFCPTNSRIIYYLLRSKKPSRKPTPSGRSMRRSGIEKNSRLTAPETGSGVR